MTATRQLPQNFVAQIAAGFFYPLRAIGFISRNRLWPMTLFAIAINVVLLAALAALTLWLVVPWLEGFDGWLMSLTDGDFLRGLLAAVSWLVWILAVILVLAADAALLLLFGQAAASPFLEMLSEEIERIQLGRPSEKFTTARAIKSLVLGLSDLIWTLAFLVVVNVPIFVIGLLTAVGAPVAAALNFGFTALMLAQEFVTLPLVRRLVSYKKRFGVVWANKWLAFGFGMAAMGVMLIPGLNLVLLPLAAAGGTLLYCDLESGGRLGAEVEAAVEKADAG